MSSTCTTCAVGGDCWQACAAQCGSIASADWLCNGSGSLMQNLCSCQPSSGSTSNVAGTSSSVALGTNTLIGVIVGIVAFVVIVALVGWWCYRTGRLGKTTSAGNVQSPSMAPHHTHNSSAVVFSTIPSASPSSAV